MQKRKPILSFHIRSLSSQNSNKTNEKSSIDILKNNSQVTQNAPNFIINPTKSLIQPKLSNKLPQILNENNTSAPTTTCLSWTIHDITRNEIIWSKNPEEVREMASLTQIMTFLTSLQIIEEHRIDLDNDFAIVPREAAVIIGTVAGLRTGDRLSYRDLLYALMLPSGNDAALALAYNLGHYLRRETSPAQKFKEKEYQLQSSLQNNSNFNYSNNNNNANMNGPYGNNNNNNNQGNNMNLDIYGNNSSNTDNFNRNSKINSNSNCYLSLSINSPRNRATSIAGMKLHNESAQKSMKDENSKAHGNNLNTLVTMTDQSIIIIPSINNISSSSSSTEGSNNNIQTSSSTSRDSPSEPDSATSKKKQSLHNVNNTQQQQQPYASPKSHSSHNNNNNTIFETGVLQLSSIFTSSGGFSNRGPMNVAISIGEGKEYFNQIVSFFVKKMNKMAFRFNLKSTRFSNPHGLAENGNHSSCYDLSRLGMLAYQKKLVREVTSQKEHRGQIFNGKGDERGVVWVNTNQLLSEKWFIGLQTGWTANAGPCLSVIYKREEVELLITLLNCQTVDYRWSEATKLAEWAYSQITQAMQINSNTGTVSNNNRSLNINSNSNDRPFSEHKQRGVKTNFNERKPIRLFQIDDNLSLVL